MTVNVIQNGALAEWRI